mgnify:CR=1 FL=1
MPDKKEKEATGKAVGDTLVVLNHLAVMSDDLYTLLGEDESSISVDQTTAILSVYEILSEIYDKIDAEFKLNSEEDDVEVDESWLYELIDELAESIDEPDVVVDEITEESVVLEGVMPDLKTLTKKLRGLGFDPVTNDKSATHTFGLKMRAGKWADTFFRVNIDDSKPFVIDVQGGKTKFDSFDAAITKLKSFNESATSIFAYEDGDKAILESVSVIKLSEILEKVSPKKNYVETKDSIVFEDVQSRDEAIEMIESYSKLVEETICHSIELGNLVEEIDEVKFKRLAQTGLVPKEEVNQVVKAIKSLEAGTKLSTAQKDLISSVFQTLVGLITGDQTVFSRISQAVK